MNAQDKDFFYIKWDRAKHVLLSQEEYNAKFRWLCDHGVLVDNRKGKGNRVRRLSWLSPWSYCVEQTGQQVNLYVRDNKRNFIVYYTNNDSSKNNRAQGVSGGRAFDLVSQMFFERHDCSLKRAFGICKDDFRFDMVNQALSPIIYTNERECGFIQTNIYKADFASAYPFGLSGDLPDYHKGTHRELRGIYKPTEEYPFAFYLNSGHMAIYGELDTYRDFRTHPFYQTRGKFRNDLYNESETTILMKASRYNLDDIMLELYNQKAKNKDVKTLMVAFIGYIRSTKSWQHHYMGHISACAYARHLKRMLFCYDKLVEAKQKIMMAATDSFCWQGRDIPEITTREKTFGSFFLEHENARLLMLANGVYGIEKDGKIECFRHQGTAEEDIDFEISKLSDIKKLASRPLRAFDQESNKYVSITPVLHQKIEL